MEYRIIRNDELYHHGVKGMKWGVRRQMQTSAARGELRSARKAVAKKATNAGKEALQKKLAARKAQSTYRRYGKGNTPLDALKRDARNKKAFTQKKRAELKAAQGPLNKGKVAASWYLDMPVTVLGFTGTKEMTFRERLIRGDGLF